jgi:hypothetical protein
MEGVKTDGNVQNYKLLLKKVDDLETGPVNRIKFVLIL